MADEAEVDGRCANTAPEDQDEAVPSPDTAPYPVSCVTLTLRLKVRPESYSWLNAATVEVNQVFNYCNETSLLAATRTDLKRKWLSGFDLCNLTSGATEYFERIGADTIQRICIEYAQKRRAVKRLKLRWRVSRGRDARSGGYRSRRRA